MTELESYRDGREQGQRDMQRTVERLQTLNAELVEAMESVVVAYESKLGKEYPAGIQKAMRNARAALAKVKEGK